MPVAGQKLRAMRERGRIDDGVRRRKLVLGAELRRRQSYGGVEIGHNAGFGECDHTVGLVFANLAGEGHVAVPLSVILPDGTIERPDLGSGDPVDAFTNELTLAVEAVATGAEPPRLSGQMARQALAVCRAEVESVLGRKPVRIT